MDSPFFRRLRRLEFIDHSEFDYAERLIRDIKSKDAGTYILNEGGLQNKIYFVMEGWAVRYKLLEDGGKQILNFVLPGDIIGMFSPIYQRSEHNVEALTRISMGCFPSDRLFDIFRESPRLALALAWIAGQDERILEEQIVRIGRRSSAKRMAHLMVELHRRLRLSGYTREEAASLPLNQLLLSDALGLSHIQAHRVFRELEKHTLIERRSGHILLNNLPFLANFANFDESYLEPVSSISKANMGLLEE